MKRHLREAFGWYGVGAILLAYALVSFGLLDGESFGYQVLNLTGASGVMVVSFVRRAYQPVVLNAVWSGIALVAILKVVL